MWNEKCDLRNVKWGYTFLEEWFVKCELWNFVWNVNSIFRKMCPRMRRLLSPNRLEIRPKLQAAQAEFCLWLTRHGRETVWSTKLSQKLSLWGCLYKRWSCYFWQKIFNTEMFFLNGEFVTSNFTSITLISKLHGFHIPQISLGYWSENHVLIYFVLRHYFHLNSI